jgi:integrase
MPWLRQRNPDILTPGETSAILEHLTPQNQIWCFWLATTGLYISELRGLQWKDVDEAFAGSLPEPK